MKHLKLFESFGVSDFNPEILTSRQYLNYTESDIHLRFTSNTATKLLINSRGKDITWNYDSKTYRHLYTNFSNNFSNVKIIFTTKFSVLKAEGDESYVYFELQFGYRNNADGFRDYVNHPIDRDLLFYGRMEKEEFYQIVSNPNVWKEYAKSKCLELDKATHKIIQESLFTDIPDPEPMDLNEWDVEVTDAEEVPFDQKEKELFIALSDSISLKNKIKSMPDIGKSSLFFQLINGDLNQRLRYTTPIRNISTYKNDDEFYYVNIWGGDDDKAYRCDGYECWEKFLKEIFAGYRDLINNQTKTNESYFDEVSEPKSLLDENGDYIPGSSRASMNNREPFNQKEKSFINQLLETLNEEYISTNFSDNTEFALNMGEMGETTHGMRVVKLTDDYYEVQYNNYVDSDDEYIYCECDGFECLSKLLIRLFEKINKDYDYEGNT